MYVIYTYLQFRTLKKVKKKIILNFTVISLVRSKTIFENIIFDENSITIDEKMGEISLFSGNKNYTHMGRQYSVYYEKNIYIGITW